MPNHLRDASRDAKGFGHGSGYLYPHAYSDHWVAQQYLPSSLSGRVFYQGSSQGWEAGVKRQVEQRREEQLEAVTIDAFRENLTYSPGDKGRRVGTARGKRAQRHDEAVRDDFCYCKPPARHDRTLIPTPGAASPLGRTPRSPEGWWPPRSRQEERDYIEHYAQTGELDRPSRGGRLPQGAITTLERASSSRQSWHTQPLQPCPGGCPPHTSCGLATRPGGSSPWLQSNLPDPGSPSSAPPELAPLVEAERTVYEDQGNALTNWDDGDLVRLFGQGGFTTRFTTADLAEQRRLSEAEVRHYMEHSYIPSLQASGASVDGQALIGQATDALANRPLSWRTHLLFLEARLA